MKTARPFLPLALAACFGPFATLRGEPLPAVELREVKLAPFAEARLEEPLPPPAKPMEKKPATLAAAKNAKEVLARLKMKLTAEQQAFLEKNAFVLAPIHATGLAMDVSAEAMEGGSADEMLAAFSEIAGDTSSPFNRQPGQAKLVTPDIVLHAWHRYFSHLLEYVEGIQMRPRLERLLTGCMANAELLAKGQPAVVQERLDWVKAQFAAAWVLLGSDEAPPAAPKAGDSEAEFLAQMQAELEASRPKADPRSVKDRLAFAKALLSARAGTALEQEVNLAMEAEGPAPSPLFGFYNDQRPADYTQFRPRSHYTKSAQLRGWFRSMMFLGRSGYSLANDRGMADALAVLCVLCEPGLAGWPPIDAWRDIMEVSSFFAGASDDITYTELRSWAAKAAGRTSFRPADAQDGELLAKLKAALKELRPPRINSSINLKPEAAIPSPEFRIFGQRFGWDALIFDHLLDKDGTGKLPSMVSGTSVMAAFGDETAADAARGFLKDTFGPKAPAFVSEFDAALPKLRKLLAGVSEDDWYSSMAAKQLHTIGGLAAPRSPLLPAYMNSPHFGARQLSCMMGSWTELKHDTVLYAKQAYAEMGEGGETDKKPPPPPRGFIQPDTHFWPRMAGLAWYAADGLQRHRLTPDAGEEFSALQQFSRDVDFCRSIAAKELAGKPLTDADYDGIWKLNFLYMDEPIEKDAATALPDPTRGMTALVTDVLTDATTGQVLQQATGRPLVVLVLTSLEDQPRLVAGLAYDHYEFTGPAAKRMTDEEWRKGLYVEKPEERPRPAWAPPLPKAAPPAKKAAATD